MSHHNRTKMDYTIEWYEKQYWTEHPYAPYQDYPRHVELFQKLMSFMPFKSFLDVGCAYGFMCARLRSKGVYTVGLDVSDWCGKQFISKGYYVRGTGWALPFKDKSFEFLYCEGTLEHIPEEKIELLFSEFARVADRGVLGVSYNSPGTEHHVCNHNFQWWAERIPPRFKLGISGRSLDLEVDWHEKTVIDEKLGVT